MGGRLIAVGNVSEQRAQLNIGYAIVNGLQIIGSSGATREDMADVIALHRRRPLGLASLIDSCLTLDEAQHAHDRIRVGGLRGRLVLENREYR